ncbi:5-methylcytosine restriction system specificity protein McrC [Pedobacter aquatilis]|uniref:McrC family protein n=1 Tax=Pedobacter aquatilis TaxID=351343 RepID=UPI00292D9E70|nr:restriction endonuclease [Pedobacter aquatilis]
MMSQQPINYEFGPRFQVKDRDKLEAYLFEIARKHQIEKDPNFNALSYRKRQSFLSFDGNHASARNYIGFIQGEGEHIEIYPKVFKDSKLNKSSILKHLFYWFDYCRKWKFPFAEVSLSNLDEVELPELIINLIAGQIFEVVSTAPISLYEQVEEALMMPKGSINFNRYMTTSLANGNFHMLECDHEPLQYDNRLNRVIKYVSRLLLAKSKFAQTRKTLEDVLFILDEVEDCPCQASMLDRIQINPFFTAYQSVIGLCKMVLEQQIYDHHQDEKSHWSLLLPMEYVFEDFIAGFLETHFSKNWEVKYQKSDLYLAEGDIFNMQHDIFLTLKSNRKVTIIIDTKYKLRGKNFKDDPKKGISQSDMYQMTAYAYRRGCHHVLLLYPNQEQICKDKDSFTVMSFDKSQKIKVHAAEIPFWDPAGHQAVSANLKTKLTALLNGIQNGL